MLKLVKGISNIRGLLIDLDGVLYVGEDVLPRARETLLRLRVSSIDLRFLTNTTTRTADSVMEKLRRMGLEVSDDEVFTPITATRNFLREQHGGKPSVHLVVRDSVLPEFSEFPREDTAPDFVVVGDIGAAWSYPLMTTIFRELHRGAELIAMHKNRFFQTEEGLSMDIGGFVAGLEFVTGHEARIIGKPSSRFFQLAMDSLGHPRENVAMIGDDIENDVGGGQAVGLNGILVKTGKYRDGCIEKAGVTPDAVLESIEELPDLLQLDVD
jgi:HAD superfamily hydrolase (TIGR01458 family)